MTRSASAVVVIPSSRPRRRWISTRHAVPPARTPPPPAPPRLGALLIPLPRLSREAPVDHPCQLRRHRRRQRRQGLAEDAELSSKPSAPGTAVAPPRVRTAPPPMPRCRSAHPPAAPQLLRRHVRQRPASVPAPSASCCDTVVASANSSPSAASPVRSPAPSPGLPGHHHIQALEIPVHNAANVRVRQRVGHLLAIAENLVYWQRAFDRRALSACPSTSSIATKVRPLICRLRRSCRCGDDSAGRRARLATRRARAVSSPSVSAGSTFSATSAADGVVHPPHLAHAPLTKEGADLIRADAGPAATFIVEADSTSAGLAG